uniref:Reverse transcriptase domain-containing protein n=1 Tax=Tanacetum cinerariifolium TaxID=118510 RepID=A0A6L2MVR4_TANCI|nr:reverse transcriptase domain-containing protein [Tanacetum cinerariifolium]
MRTRSFLNLLGESSPNTTSSNLRRRNRRRSKQPSILEESPVDTMADQQTIVELLRAPTEGYAEVIVVPPILAEQFKLKHSLINMMTLDQFFRLEKDNPYDHIRWFDESFHEAWDRYKDLLRACPHYGFTELHQLDTFYNALNPANQDSLNSVVDGNLLERRTQDVLTIIENKSKVRNSQNKLIVSQVKSGDANSSSSSEIAKLTHAVNQQTSAVTTVCHAADGNTFLEFQDNIQGYVSAAVVNYNQGTSSYRPPVVPLRELEKIKKMNEINMKAMQTQINNVKNKLRNEMKTSIQALMSNQTNELKNMMGSFFQMNTTSTSGSGPLPSNTIANPRGELKAITTRSGIVLDGPSVPMPHPFINLEEDERIDETLMDLELGEFTIKKMLKALISNKEKLLELENTPLNENCLAVTLKKLPKKLGDRGKFLILCSFSELKCKALAYPGASINLMPLFVWKKLGLPELISTRMTLELANRAICTPTGITRDVFVPVGKFIVPTDFVIVDYESDLRKTKLTLKQKKAIHLILTGIGNEIYSTVDACQTAQEMWEAIERLKQGKEIAKPITPPSETASEEDNDPEQAQRDEDMQKNFALIAKYFKKIYNPTNNNLRTFSNSRNKNVDTTPREKVGSLVVQQTGIRCFNCKEFRHFAKECREPKRVKDFAYHKEKMLLCKQAEQEAHYSYMAEIQEVPTADTGTDSEPVEHVQNDVRYNVFANDLQHFEQSEYVSNTCLVETDDSNVIPDSPDMCEDDIQNDQNDVESDNELKMSRYVLTVSSTMRILLLYRGEYSQWVERFMNYLKEQTDGEAMINSIKNGDQPLPRVTQVHMLGSEYGEQDRKAAVLYEYETFKANEGELFLDTYIRYLKVINDLKKFGYSKDNCELNFKLLNNLQPEWKQYATMMRQNKNLMDINIDALYNILKQNQGYVNDAMGSKKKTIMVTSDPLALIAEKTNVNRSKEKVVVSSDSKGSEAGDFKFVKSDDKKVVKKYDEKKQDMSRVKCYNCKKEGYFAKDCKKAKVKDYEYYKTKMLLAKKDKDEQVLLTEDQAWMESSSDSDQEINANMVFMAQIEKVLSDLEASSSSADKKISEVSYYLSESESKSEFKTSEYYDNSTNYGLFVNNDDDQEIFHDAIDSASEIFIENHIDSQKDYDKSDVDHNDSKEKDQLVDKLIRKFNKMIVKCHNRIEKANQQSKNFENQNKDLQDKYDVLKNQTTTFEMNNKELNEQLKELIEKNNDLLAQTKYFLMTAYALWEVIVNGDSPPPKKTVDGVEQSYPPTTAKEKLARKNKLKARDLETLSMDGLYNNLKISEAEVIRSSSISQNTQNVAFMSSNNTDSTNKAVKTAHGVSAANSKDNASNLPNVDSLSDAVIYSFFASQSNNLKLNNEDLKQIDPDDLEKMDLKWQMAMASKHQDNINREATRRTVPIEETTLNALVSKCDGFSYDWSDQAEEGPTNFALMAYTFSSSSNSDTEVSTCSKACLKSYKTLKEHYDNLTKDFSKSQLNVGAYKTGLESVKARLEVYKKNEAVFEEDIKILKLDVMFKDKALTELRKIFVKAKKERDDLKLTLENFENSYKNLSKLLNSQVSDMFKTGVGFYSQLLDSQVNDKYKTGVGYHVVPHPYIGNFMPPKPDLMFVDVDEHVVSKSVTSVPAIATSEAKTRNLLRRKRIIGKPDTLGKTVKVLEMILAQIELFTDQQIMKIYELQNVILEGGKALSQEHAKVNQSLSDTIISENLKSPYHAANYIARMSTATNKLSNLKDIVNQVKTVNGEEQIQALMDKKKVIIIETSVRSDLQLLDVEGTECLPNATIFKQLTLMCAKTTAWNEFSSTMASAIIYLATNQKFNFSKYIFDNMVKNLEGGVKFLMFLRFVQVFLDKQVKRMFRHKEIYVIPSHTKKVFANIKRQEESLGDQEDASKQGRKIDDINQDAEITLVDETQGWINEEEMFRVNDQDGDEVIIDATTGEKVKQSEKVAKREVSTTDPVTTAGEVVTTAAGVEVKGIVMQEPSETHTPTPIVSSQQPLKVQDKEATKKHFAKIRARDKRNKPPTQAQQRKLYCNYLKNIEGYTLKQLKSFKFEVMKDMFDKDFKRVNTFVDYKTELMEESSKKAETEKETSSKRAGDELEYENLRNRS